MDDLESVDIDSMLGKFYRESTKKDGCCAEARRLWVENDFQGETYWVCEVEGVLVGHAYYVPDVSRLDDLALNQADNGFEGFPALTVRQVIEDGRVEYSEGSERGYIDLARKRGE